MSLTVSLKELIESGAHFGHQVKRWNPKMSEYLYGEKDGVHIFDLTKTKPLLEEALEVLKNASKAGKVILFVGTKKQVKEEIAVKAKEAGVYYINERWLGGTLTNLEQIKRSLRRMNEIEAGFEKNEYANRTKKERLLIKRDKDRLERFFGGINGLERMPEILVIVDTKREKTAIREAKAMEVETIGLVDSNSNPTDVDYPVPMNDDASKALDYVLGLMRDAILEGKGKSNTSSKSSESRKGSKGKNKDN